MTWPNFSPPKKFHQSSREFGSFLRSVEKVMLQKVIEISTPTHGTVANFLTDLDKDEKEDAAVADFLKDIEKEQGGGGDDWSTSMSSWNTTFFTNYQDECLNLLEING